MDRGTTLPSQILTFATRADPDAPGAQNIVSRVHETPIGSDNLFRGFDPTNQIFRKSDSVVRQNAMYTDGGDWSSELA